jgi:hypothetical protein
MRSNKELEGAECECQMMHLSPLRRSGRMMLVVVTVLLTGTHFSVSQSPEQVEQLINTLPECSVLRTELENGRHGDGVLRSYMARMQGLGVERARLELQAVIRKNRPANIQVVRRLYYRKFDAPNSQIMDEGELKLIETGIQGDLDDTARERASRAHIVRGPGLHFKQPKRLTSYIEFLANQWLLEQEVYWFPSGRTVSPFTPAVTQSDAAQTLVLLKSHAFTTEQINRALLYAALSRYDNSAVIALLIHAGADPNTRFSDATTPLMIAIDHPCNLRPLLDGGADPNLRDKWGKTALDSARWRKNTVAIRILQEASANSL